MIVSRTPRHQGRMRVAQPLYYTVEPSDQADSRNTHKPVPVVSIVTNCADRGLRAVCDAARSASARFRPPMARTARSCAGRRAACSGPNTGGPRCGYSECGRHVLRCVGICLSGTPLTPDRSDVDIPPAGLWRRQQPAASGRWPAPGLNDGQLSPGAGYRLNGTPAIPLGPAISASLTVDRITRQSRRRSRQFLPRRLELHTAPAYLASAPGCNGHFSFSRAQRRYRISYP